MSNERHTSSGDERLDRTLRALGDVEAPPLGDELETELGSLEPVRTRRPRRGLAAVLGASVAWVALFLAVAGVRDDITNHSKLWITGYSALWLVSFSALLWLATMPRRGEMVYRWRFAGTLAVIAALGFIAAGMIMARTVEGSFTYDPTISSVVEHGRWCMSFGLVTAIVPIVLGMLLVRGAIPVRSRWIAAGLGAAGGSLGGFMLQVHCHISERFHMAFVHGGVVVVAAVLGALILPRQLEPR